MLLDMAADEAQMSESHLQLIDDVAKLLLDRDVPIEKLQSYMTHDNFKITNKVLRYDPNAPEQPPKQVDLYDTPPA